MNKMKTSLKLLAGLSAGAVLLLSCAKVQEEDPQETAAAPEANVPEPDETPAREGYWYEKVGVCVGAGSKVSFDENTGKFTWQGNEKVLVQRSGGTAYEATVSTVGSAAEITVELAEGETRSGFAYYPANIGNASAALRSLDVTLPSKYGSPGSDNYIYPYAPTPMIGQQADASGVVTSDKITFYHLGGVALLTLNAGDFTHYEGSVPSANQVLKHIKIVADKKICGDFTATASSGHYQIATDGSSSDSMVQYRLASALRPSNVDDSPHSGKIIVPLPVGNYTILSVEGWSNESTSNILAKGGMVDRFSIVRAGGVKRELEMKPWWPKDYGAYDLVFGTANCIVDGGTASGRSVTFDVTPYEAGENYTYTRIIADFTAHDQTLDRVPTSAKVLWYEGYSAAPAISLDKSSYPWKATVSNLSGTGNAVVALCNTGGDIVWSFHIWSPGFDPTESANRTWCNGNVLMGLSLGAMSAETSAEDINLADACGMYYQWGRKDPLGRSDGTVGGDYALKAMTEVGGTAPSTSSVVAVGSGFSDSEDPDEHILYTLSHPHVQITSNINGSYNWLTAATYSSEKFDNKLWGTTCASGPVYTEYGKTIFDPCPAGWKVANTYQGINSPVSKYWDVTHVADKGKTMTDTGKGGCSTDFAPYCGLRHRGSGVVNYVGQEGSCWSSSSSAADQTAQCWRVSMPGNSDDKFTRAHPADRASARTVRCVKL